MRALRAAIRSSALTLPSPPGRVAGGRVRGTRQRKGNAASNRSQPRRTRWIKANQAPFKPDQVKSSPIKVNQAWRNRGTAGEVGCGMGSQMEKPSRMFAYVRVCSLNSEKIVEGAPRNHWGTGKTGRFQMSHCETFDIGLDRRRLRKCSRRCARPLPGIAEWESRRLERS